jgi:hypothetical protein
MFFVYVRDSCGPFLFLETLEGGEALFEYMRLKDLGYDTYKEYKAMRFGLSKF